MTPNTKKGGFAMLTAALFMAVFFTITWIAYAFRFISSSLSGISFFDAGILNVLLYTLFAGLPVFLIWVIFGFIGQYLHTKNSSRQMFRLFSQMKKNQEYSDLLARIMLDLGQNLKNSSVLNCFELLVADMNELLSDLILRLRIVSKEQVEILWTKVQNGGKWSFGKVLVENYNRQPAFQERVYNVASSEGIVAGTILEFCARYQSLISLLEKHDKDKIFLNIIETGVFGKVYSILAPVADKLQLLREGFGAPSEPVRPVVQPPVHDMAPKQPAVKSFIKRIYPFKKSESDVKKSVVKDPFSLALERSFADEEAPQATPQEFKTEREEFYNAEKNEPEFTVEAPEEGIADKDIYIYPEKSGVEDANKEDEDSEGFYIEPTIEEEPAMATNTQMTLESLKKEWQEIEVKNNTEDDEELAYPFGGWTDADNYQK